MVGQLTPGTGVQVTLSTGHMYWGKVKDHRKAIEDGEFVRRDEVVLTDLLMVFPTGAVGMPSEGHFHPAHIVAYLVADEGPIILQPSQRSSLELAQSLPGGINA